MSGDELTPYERLMAEALPTGTFGNSRSAKARRTPAPPLPAPAATHRATDATRPAPHEPWTPEDQARHVADMLAELLEWEWHDEYADAKREQKRDYHERRTHLRLITDPADETAA